MEALNINVTCVMLNLNGKWTCMYTRRRNILITILPVICVRAYFQRRNFYQAISKTYKSSRLSCDLCKMTFKTKLGLVQHKQVKHEGVKFHCSECGHISRRKGDLARHMNTVHNKRSKGK